MTGFRT